MSRLARFAALLACAPPVLAQGPTVNPANGHAYEAVAGTFTWDQANAMAQASTYNGAPGHLATIADAAENDFLEAGLGVVTDRHWLGGFQDMSDPNYAEPDLGWAWVTGEPFTYTSWKANEPNDFGGAEHYLAFDNGPPEWNDAPVDWAFAAGFIIEYEGGPGLGYCFGDGGGTGCPCGNAGGSGEGCQNSSGVGGVLAAGGSSSAAADDLSFSAGQLLPNQPALLFVGGSRVSGGDGLVFGDGLRCAGQGVVRLGTRTPDANGDASWGPGLSAQGGWGAGDTRYFQGWYRDPAGPCGFGFNLTHGVEVTFAP